jgi:hypothetical protein
MHGIIAVLLLVFCVNVYAEKWPVWPQIQAAKESLGWIVDPYNAIGHTTRVPLYIGQDPFPFCAAVSASILHDQHECMTANKDCSRQPRISFLPLVSASQNTPGKINWDNGGNTFLALEKILKDGGGAAYSSCNYDNITNPRKNKGTEFVRLYGTHAGYRHFSQWKGYMTRYHRDEFLFHLSDLGLYRQGVESLLGQTFSSAHDLIYAVIFNDACNQISIKSSKQYKLKTMDVTESNVALKYNTIKHLLSKNIPVGINLCLNVDAGWKTCSRHSLVIFAQSIAHNTVTGDTRRVYRIANTWGEKWTAENSNGWVFADQLFLGIYDIFWLE